MRTLSKYWLTEPSLDFEYKKYVLLGWLKEVESRFTASRLFPAWNTVRKEHERLVELQLAGDTLWSAFPKVLTGLDWAHKKLRYRNLQKSSTALTEVQEIIQFAIPRMQEAVNAGSQLRQRVQKSTALSSVGLLPLYLNDGYLLVFKQPDVHIYAFQLSSIRLHQHTEAWQDVQLEHVKSMRAVRSLPPEYIKRDLIQHYPGRPNPATFAFESEGHWPLAETLLPAAREALFTRIAA